MFGYDHTQRDLSCFTILKKDNENFKDHNFSSTAHFGANNKHPYGSISANNVHAQITMNLKAQVGFKPTPSHMFLLEKMH